MASFDIPDGGATAVAILLCILTGVSHLIHIYLAYVKVQGLCARDRLLEATRILATAQGQSGQPDLEMQVIVGPTSETNSTNPPDGDA
ncbi:hypothetical protein M8818_005616 [Zalaria obscura]|uniref:Uncharacterized protein n=1 Tax=Zalaria obscura TaxID=2024903 RepID=A0ACC3SBJ9_9PEZI